jgi:hypothetical protein
VNGVRCEVGTVFEIGCDGAAVAVVEYMPEQHRASHKEAGNRGVYPHNGAVQLRVCDACAVRVVESNPGWAKRVHS